MSGAVPFIDEAPEYEIRDKNMHITAGDWTMAMSLRNFELGMARASRVIAEHYAKRAEVVPIKGKRGRHAARS